MTEMGIRVDESGICLAARVTGEITLTSMAMLAKIECDRIVRYVTGMLAMLGGGI